MENIVIYGAGGFGREVHVLIKQLNNHKEKYNVLGFIDDTIELSGTEVNGLKVLGNRKYLIDYKEHVLVAVALIMDKKEKVIKELLQNENLKFVNLIHPAIYWDETNRIGIGNILCHGMNITCNVNIGDFNIFNGRVGIGHDVSIGDFNLFGPNAFIAGNVNIGNNNTFALNTAVLQQKKIGNGNVLNMSSVLIKNIDDDGVYYGIPAMKQTF